MATLLSITARRRDGVQPSGNCPRQLASVPPTADLAALTAQYYRRWQPVVIEERLLVDLLIAADWQLRRLQSGRQWSPTEPA